MDANKGKLRFASILTLLVACALFLIAHLVYLFLANPKKFPINTVKISASYHHISHHQLKEVLENYARWSFFSFPVTRLQTELMALEWSDQVQVERVWPDILKITLVEKIPFAIWNNALLTKEGEIFNEGGDLAEIFLPRLKGTRNHAKQLLQVFQKMSKILSRYGLYAAELELRDNEAWELTLSNGVQLRLGKRDLEMKINRFCKAYPTVFAGRSDQLASVDLRYPRGMAVQWKKKREENG